MDRASISPLLGRDINWLLEHWSTARASEGFLFWSPFDGTPVDWTWAEFVRDVREIAAGLQTRGLVPGDRVALVLGNHPDFILFWTAIVAAGGVAICVNPESTEDDLAYVAAKTTPVGAIVEEARANVVTDAMNPDWLICSNLNVAGRRTMATVDAAIAKSNFETGPLPPEAPASIQFTSGTTARPKGVVWTQANIMWAASRGAMHQGLGPDDRNLIHLPLFHTNGLSYSFLSSLWSGGSIVLQPKFSVTRFWAVAEQYECTWSSMVSFCINALRRRGLPRKHSFRGWGHSTVIAPEPSLGGVPTMGWFGMTETVSHPIYSSYLHGDSAGSMGRPAAEYDVRIVNDEGVDAGVGEVGELRIRGVRGVSLFAGYLDDIAATNAAFDGDWFLTGDRVSLDETGAIKFEERAKDLLKIGGENVGAVEIERVILSVPGVREVAVVGRPHPMLGETPIAFVIKSADAILGEDELKTTCERMLPPFKRPTEFRFVQEFPRSSLNKVAKSGLRSAVAHG